MNDRSRQRHPLCWTLAGWLISAAIAFVCCIALLGRGFAQTHSGRTVTAPTVAFQTLASFDGTNGAAPISNLIQGFDGSLYGTANYSGGAVFRVATDGSLTALHTYCAGSDCAGGSAFVGALVQGLDGNLYGETALGGNPSCISGYGCGTIVRVGLDGSSVVLHTFSGTDGDDPQGGLLQATDGNFYGTTSDIEIRGRGTVFKMSPHGDVTTLYNFCGEVCHGGSQPTAALMQATDGNLYGTTQIGGAPPNFKGGSGNCPALYGCGAVFAMTLQGKVTTLHRFCVQTNCPDGLSPNAGLIQGEDGNLYGTTYAGGAHSAGTIFKITTSGSFATLYSFCALPGCADGAGPYFGPLVQGTDGNLYGTTNGGGINVGWGAGTVFSITPQGSLTTLYTFCQGNVCTDGSGPFAGLVQATDGSFYGTTGFGGSYGYGTVFRIDVGLGPFVATVPAGGKVRSEAIILATNLTGASGVTFNGTPASFTVVSATEIKVAVPAKATTGPVEVTTPSGVLTSNKNFVVVQ
jgi:uncharacterized repeat protein (TIGR03803 family)